MGRLLNDFAKDVESTARRLAPYGYQDARFSRKPGELKRGIRRSDADFGPSGLSLVVGVDERVDHAMPIHQGHGKIYPKKKKYLRFQDRYGVWHVRDKSQPVRAVAGYPFLFAAVKEANERLPADARFKFTIHARPRGGKGPNGLKPLKW